MCKKPSWLNQSKTWMSCQYYTQSTFLRNNEVASSLTLTTRNFFSIEIMGVKKKTTFAFRRQQGRPAIRRSSDSLWRFQGNWSLCLWEAQTIDRLLLHIVGGREGNWVRYWAVWKDTSQEFVFGSLVILFYYRASLGKRNAFIVSYPKLVTTLWGI